jgi:alkenylglycerophosphocholine hydrolase
VVWRVSIEGKRWLQSGLRTFFQKLKHTHAHTGGRKKFKFLFWGLLLSAGGDITLVYPGQQAFLTGLGLFLCAHLCYIVAFMQRPKFTPIRVIGALVALGGLFANVTVLTPPPDMVVPVSVYSFVIAVMVASTMLGTNHDNLLAILGSISFSISDFLIAIGMFNWHTDTHLAVMVTYYTAQILIHQSKLLQ